MAKIGVELSIDVTKIEKARLYQGKKGTYLTMTVFVDPDKDDQYGNNGMITHKKAEGEDRAPILGNCKVFWKQGQQQNQQPNNYAQQQVHNGQNTNYQNQPNPANYPPPSAFDDFDDGMPF